MMIKKISACFCVGLSLVFSACDSGSSGDDNSNTRTVFSNESSATVTVRPEGDETFDLFTFGPGESVTVERVGDSIEFNFSATNSVAEQNVSNAEVVFTNP